MQITVSVANQNHYDSQHRKGIFEVSLSYEFGVLPGSNEDFTRDGDELRYRTSKRCQRYTALYENSARVSTLLRPLV